MSLLIPLQTQVIPTKSEGTIRCVLLAGFETFNLSLYQKVADALRASHSQIDVLVFTERDIENRKSEIESALRGADVLFCSLLFDYDQVEWLRAYADQVPVRFIFESALELMSVTQVSRPSDVVRGRLLSLSFQTLYTPLMRTHRLEALT